MFLLAQFRPQFIEATQDALWNGWFFVAYAIPFLIIVPFSYWRFGGCLVAPVAFIGSWLVYAYAIDIYDESFELNAVTESEWDAVTSDTGRTFAPFIHGTPKTLLATFLAYAVGYFVGGWLRITQRNKQRTKQDKMMIDFSTGTPVEPRRSENPYEPPSN
jgi:hypothetical protein